MIDYDSPSLTLFLFTGVPRETIYLYPYRISNLYPYKFIYLWGY